MKPGPFTYHAPETLDEALALLAEHGDDARPLAGGQSLVPIMALRMGHYPHVVDLNRAPELVGAEVANGSARIGAMTRQADLERFDAVPLLARATPLIGHFQIRNRGTIGGSIAHADPAAEYPAVALALGAEVDVRSASGQRTIAAADLFEGMWSTTLEPAELITAIELPTPAAGEGSAIEEVARRHGDFAIAGAAVRVAVDATGSVTSASVALFGVASAPLVAEAAGQALLAGETDLAEVGRAATASLELLDDVHASAAYRRAAGAVVVERALGRALEEARGG